MALIKDQALVDDPWVTVDDETELAGVSHAIIGLERWQRERAGLTGHNGRLGLRLKSDQSPALVVDDLDRFDVVALEFPHFADGRAFTYARLLRERYRYTGEVRAVGQVLRDQAQFMRRCGFDAFEVADATGLDDWLQALDEITVSYQPAADRRPWVTELRQR